MSILIFFISLTLHDIGKVGIPDDILLKPGKLTNEEFEIMKQHAAYGHDAIRATEKKLAKKFTFLHFAAEIAQNHHEKWDGSGYPVGLSGGRIPISGRLMALGACPRIAIFSQIEAFVQFYRRHMFDIPRIKFHK